MTSDTAESCLMHFMRLSLPQSPQKPHSYSQMILTHPAWPPKSKELPNLPDTDLGIYAANAVKFSSANLDPSARDWGLRLQQSRKSIWKTGCQLKRPAKLKACLVSFLVFSKHRKYKIPVWLMWFAQPCAALHSHIRQDFLQ